MIAGETNDVTDFWFWATTAITTTSATAAAATATIDPAYTALSSVTRGALWNKK